MQYIFSDCSLHVSVLFSRIDCLVCSVICASRLFWVMYSLVVWCRRSKAWCHMISVRAVQSGITPSQVVRCSPGPIVQPASFGRAIQRGPGCCIVHATRSRPQLYTIDCCAPPFNSKERNNFTALDIKAVVSIFLNKCQVGTRVSPTRCWL